MHLSSRKQIDPDINSNERTEGTKRREAIIYDWNANKNYHKICDNIRIKIEQTD